MSSLHSLSAPQPLTSSEFQTFHRLIGSNHKSAIAFAHYPTTPVQPHFVVSETLTDKPIRWARPHEFQDILHTPNLLSPALRYGRTIASFSLYPESCRDLQINHLLWQTAQTGEYSPVNGNMLLQNNVFSVSIPHAFHSFLADVTVHQLDTCILEILALIAEEEDEQGFHLMQSELDPPVWNQLNHYLHHQSQRTHNLEQCTSAGVKLSSYVELLLKLCYHSPWKIDVHMAYISPRTMMSALLAASKKSPDHVRNHLHDCCDRKLVRSAGKRPVSLSPQHRSHASRIPSSFANRNSVFWKLFQEWRRYRWMLVHLLGVHPGEAATLLINAISHGRREKAWKQVDTITKIFRETLKFRTSDTLLPALPEDVISTKLAPFVLLSESKG